MKEPFYEEHDFMNELAYQLGRDNLEVERSPINIFDLVVKNPVTNQRVIIELKNGGQSGELPVSLASLLYYQKMRLAPHDELFLVTFSSISSYLKDKLQALGIKSFAKPTPDQVAKEIKQAIAA